MIKSIIGLGLVGVFVFAGLQIWSSDNVSDESGQQLGGDNVAEFVLPQGRVAYIDPRTGELRSGPAPDQTAIAQGRVAQRDVDLPPVKFTTHSNGMVQADLNGHFRIPLVATIGCDGQITTEHTNGLTHTNDDCEAE